VRTRVVPAAEGTDAAVAALAEGLPVALPTETVYGLAADALNPIACSRIFEAKQRPLDDPLIVHIADEQGLAQVTIQDPDTAQTVEELVRAFWPGPLTLVLPKQPQIPDIVTSGQQTVAIRCSAHPDFQAVCKAFGRPLAAPSANRFGRISPTSAADTLEELDGRIPLILDGGACRHGIESTILHVRDRNLSILRAGPISSEELESFGQVLPSVTGISTPGNLKSHYAPVHRLGLVRDPDEIPPVRRAETGLLLPSADRLPGGFPCVEILSETGNLREMAANLFGAMRRLDRSGVQSIAAVLPPENGIGVAIAERLRKAAADE